MKHTFSALIIRFACKMALLPIYTDSLCCAHRKLKNVPYDYNERK